ncbi:hypothetical protein BOTNAR_0010g00560 [Botryotinia narcissicola]|uniref:Uncharacterized protein n=1 Tax=Botryotinia narcissicola TaxID=278944 RepID=A0A4Z1J735_9HELO|nr:hypothetical protein BOTNAR_0010g00560 [Botryotinia narcissicola]
MRHIVRFNTPPRMNIVWYMDFKLLCKGQQIVQNSTEGPEVTFDWDYSRHLKLAPRISVSRQHPLPHLTPAYRDGYQLFSGNGMATTLAEMERKASKAKHFNKEEGIESIKTSTRDSAPWPDHSWTFSHKAFTSSTTRTHQAPPEFSSEWAINLSLFRFRR